MKRLLIAVLALLAPAALAASEAEVKAAVERAYKVKVLKMAKSADGATYRVTFMAAGGDSNLAFQVATVTVDAQSGLMLPSYRHLPSGLADTESPMMRPNRQSDSALGDRSVWR